MGGLVGLNGEKKGMRCGREDARLAEKVEELGGWLTSERMQHSSCVVIEDVDAPVLVPRGCKAAVCRLRFSISKSPLSTHLSSLAFFQDHPLLLSL